MLEEALRDEKRNPSETATAMLQFIQYDLAAGGATAEARFYSTLFGPLCDRIFGTMDDKWIHHGGWLSKQTQWSRAPSASSSRTSGGGLTPTSGGPHLRHSTSWDSDSVVRLLATAKKQQPTLPTLVEAISNESENRPCVGFSFPFFALPRVTQDAWMALLELSLICNQMMSSVRHQQLLRFVTDNDVRLYGEILRNPPRKQPALLRLRHAQAQKEAVHSMQPQFQPSPLNQTAASFPPRSFYSSPAASMNPTASVIGPHSTKFDEDNKALNVIFSMLEYYLVIFLRFPLAMLPSPLNPSASPTSTMRPKTYLGDNRAYGEIVYEYLFWRYLNHFIPYALDDGHCIILNGSSSNNLQSEVFVRLVLSLWMEAPMRVTPTDEVLQSQRDEQLLAHHGQPNTTTGASMSNTASLVSLDRSFDLVQAKDFAPPPSHVKTCMEKLLLHLLSDPSIRLTVPKHTTGALLANHALWVVQPSFYNYIRASLRYGSIHSKDSAFYSAFDLWLLWLEPWNCIRSKLGTLKDTRQSRTRLFVPKYSDISRYDSSWEPYIAANMCLYLVPLAIFLRRSRELDFSIHEFEPSIRRVKRVFRVFTPQVVQVLTKVSVPGGDPNYSYLVQQHMERLGKFAPPRAAAFASSMGDMASLSLKSCQGDMHGLLEEVYMQHLKKIRDLDVLERLLAWAQGRFGMGFIEGEKKELDDLVQRAKAIVALPQDYTVFPRTGEASDRLRRAATSDSNVPVRTRDGQLTQRGREQVILGEIKCRPTDVVFVGDRMRSAKRPHEIPLLVSATLSASDWANGKLGLSGDGSGFRVNLRFLADYRNLLFLLLTSYFLLKWLF